MVTRKALDCIQADQNKSDLKGAISNAYKHVNAIKEREKENTKVEEVKGHVKDGKIDIEDIKNNTEGLVIRD